MLTVLAGLSMLVTGVLTLMCLDWTGTRGPRPLWFFLLPAGSGLLGGGAGLLARRPVLGVLAAAWGLFALPVAFWVVTWRYGP